MYYSASPDCCHIHISSRDCYYLGQTQEGEGTGTEGGTTEGAGETAAGIEGDTGGLANKRGVSDGAFPSADTPARMEGAGTAGETGRPAGKEGVSEGAALSVVDPSMGAPAFRNASNVGNTSMEEMVKEGTPSVDAMDMG